MNRFALGFILLTACGGSKSSGSSTSICDGPSAPAICTTACDPASGTGDATCGAGFHCASTGKCDAQCTAGGSECSAGFVCSTDGFCNADDGSGGGDDDSPPVDADCPALQFTATKVTPSVELLIDRSGSMAEDFSGRDPGKSGSGAMPPYKFPTEQMALVGANGVVTQLQNSVYFGATMYPGSTCTATFQAPRMIGNAAAISALIANHGPGGSTPTADAINAVVQDFSDNPPPAASPAIIVLATDGLPHACDGSTTIQPSVDAAANAFSKGIKLYLLAVGNEITDNFRIPVANAGQGVQTGQPNAKSYTATNPTELAAAFQEIIGSAVSCDLKLNGMVQADYASTGVVMLNGTALTYTTDWNLDADGTTIHLVGAACTTLKTSANPTLSATFACGSGVIF